jgi:hypothetical protein
MQKEGRKEGKEEGREEGEGRRVLRCKKGWNNLTSNF